MGDVDTGVWIEELAAPYYAFQEAGYEIVLASIAGGPIPLDEGSFGAGFFTEDSKKFMHDGTAMGQLFHSVKVDDVDFASLDAIFMPGGHGTCVDFDNNAALQQGIETMYNAKKIVSSVCHGPHCFVPCKKANGDPLVKGETVTGFSAAEEAQVQKTELVPYLLEDKFNELGATYTKGDAWTAHVVVSGHLITGQNPQSSTDTAKAVIAALK